MILVTYPSKKIYEVYKMKKQLIYFTNEKDAAFKAAHEEKPFPASDILEEIAPLLSDYFEGNFVRTQDKIVMSFYNGQKFDLTISEIK